MEIRDFDFQINKLQQTLYSLSLDVAKRAQNAFLTELYLTPKPGLVDRFNSGSHRDMDFLTFIASINAISPYLSEFYYCGLTSQQNSPKDFLDEIRQIGMQCEKKMFIATQNINTHKGGIFLFALLISAIGKLNKTIKILHYEDICREVSTTCSDLVKNELELNHEAKTVGEKLYKQYGFTGARGEAESGYSTIRNIALPVYLELKDKGIDEEYCLFETMLHLLAYNNDTNLVSRGGIEGLYFVQNAAKELIDCGGIFDKAIIEKLHLLDKKLIEKNLSPGGSADLLAATRFLAFYA